MPKMSEKVQKKSQSQKEKKKNQKKKHKKRSVLLKTDLLVTNRSSSWAPKKVPTELTAEYCVKTSFETKLFFN